MAKVTRGEWGELSVHCVFAYGMAVPLFIFIFVLDFALLYELCGGVFSHYSFFLLNVTITLKNNRCLNTHTRVFYAVNLEFVLKFLITVT